MKVYFTASARGKKQFGSYYQKVFNEIEKQGHTNLDNVICRADEASFYEGTHAERIKLYQQAMNSIKLSDVVVLDVSVHSLSMGYVMHKALDMGKPVIALYLAENEPYFASGIEDEKLQVLEYTDESLPNVLRTALEYAQDQADTRFNFFISPSLSHYLDWVASTKKVPRSVYLRQLIEEDREKNKDYYNSV